jgi:hypothetical protein
VGRLARREHEEDRLQVRAVDGLGLAAALGNERELRLREVDVAHAAAQRAPPARVDRHPVLAVHRHRVHCGGPECGERLCARSRGLSGRFRQIRIVVIDGHGSQDLLGRRQLLGLARIVVIARQHSSRRNAAEELLRRSGDGAHRLGIELLERAGADRRRIPSRYRGSGGGDFRVGNRLRPGDSRFPLFRRRRCRRGPVRLGCRRRPFGIGRLRGWLRGPLRFLGRGWGRVPRAARGVGCRRRVPVGSAAQRAPIGGSALQGRRGFGLARFLEIRRRRLGLPLLDRLLRSDVPRVVGAGSLGFRSLRNRLLRRRRFPRSRGRHLPGLGGAVRTVRGGGELRGVLRDRLAPRRRPRLRG